MKTSEEIKQDCKRTNVSNNTRFVFSQLELTAFENAIRQEAVDEYEREHKSADWRRKFLGKPKTTE